MRTVNNHKILLIGKKTVTTGSAVLVSNALTSAQTNAVIVSPATLGDGEIAMVREDGALLAKSGIAFVAPTSLASVKKVYFAQGQGANLPLIKSAMVYKANANYVKGKLYSAGVEQVSYIGYNAVLGTGDFDAIVSNDYIIRAELKSNFAEFADKAMILQGATTTGTTAVKETIVTELVKNLIANSERYVNIPFMVERVSDAADAVLTQGGTLTTLSFTKGSKVVVGDTNVIGDDITNVAVGDWIKIATGVDVAAYKVVSIVLATATTPYTATLDVAYQGADVTVAFGTATVVTAANYTAGAVGIKLTGLPVKFKEGVFRYEKSKWLTNIQNGGTTAVADQVIANEGSGLYEQIAEDEWFYQLQEGFADSVTIQIPPVTFRKNVVFGGTYSQIEAQWSYSEGTDIINNPTAYLQLKIAVDGSSRAGTLASIADAIEAWTGLTAII